MAMDNKIPSKDSDRKANRLLYMVIVAVLCITALIIGLTAALGRRTETETPEGSLSDSLPGESEGQESEKTPTDGDPEPEGDVVLSAPLAGIVSKSHSSDVLVFSMTMNDFRIHEGIDIAATLGSPVYAAAAGTVLEVWEDPMMGKCISIDHGRDTVSVYKNLDPAVAEGIEAGASVLAMQRIGSVGESAVLELADEPHLHFEVLKSGISVDPMAHLSDESIETWLGGSDAVED